VLPIIKIENAQGEVLNLSTDPRYFAELTGTGPPPATINRTKIAMADGSRYNSGSVNERQLVLIVSLLRDVGRARINLYKWLVSNAYIKIYYQWEDMDLCIEGYVETPETNPWVLGQVVQASIICPQPFWQDIGETYHDATDVDNLFEFPFAIEEEGVELSTIDVTASATITNGGQVSTGIRIELRATLHTLRPRIYNMETGEWIGFNAELQAGDRLIIDTAQGRKSVTHVRGGERTNYMSTLMPGSSWLQLEPGQNELTYTVDEGAITLSIYHRNKYQGV